MTVSFGFIKRPEWMNNNEQVSGPNPSNQDRGYVRMARETSGVFNVTLSWLKPKVAIWRGGRFFFILFLF